MIVVADTSPLRYLILIEEVRVLPALYGRVVVADGAEHGLLNLRVALDRLRETNFRADEQLFRRLLARVERT